MADPIFADPRLAEIYDRLDPVRDDLDVYAGIVADLGAGSVLDVGCGTGTFACPLAERGLEVIGVHPATASLAVARRKRHADRVKWLDGDAASLPRLHVDLSTMTANVAQVFLTDDDWSATLRGVRAALKPWASRLRDTGPGDECLAGLDSGTNSVPDRDPGCWSRGERVRGDERGRVVGVIPLDLRVRVRRRCRHLGLDAAVPQSCRGRRVVGGRVRALNRHGFESWVRETLI